MKTVRLNNDVIMPMVGYGTYQIPAAKTRDNVLQALHRLPADRHGSVLRE